MVETQGPLMKWIVILMTAGAIIGLGWLQFGQEITFQVNRFFDSPDGGVEAIIDDNPAIEIAVRNELDAAETYLWPAVVTRLSVCDRLPCPEGVMDAEITANVRIALVRNGWVEYPAADRDPLNALWRHDTNPGR